MIRFLLILIITLVSILLQIHPQISLVPGTEFSMRVVNLLAGPTLFIIRIYSVVPEASTFLSNASTQTLALTTTIPLVRQLSRKLIS